MSSSRHDNKKGGGNPTGRGDKRQSDGTNEINNRNNINNPQKMTLADYVSDYGMVADAFSLGATIRYMLTGVPPNISVDEFIAMESSPVVVVMRMIGKAIRGIRKKVGTKDGEAKKNNNYKKKRKNYRTNGEIPREAADLVRGLTHWDPRKRTTVREAKSYPWVASILNNPSGIGTCNARVTNDGKDNSSSVTSIEEPPSPQVGHGRVQFLRCALGNSNFGGGQQEGQFPSGQKVPEKC